MLLSCHLYWFSLVELKASTSLMWTHPTISPLNCFHYIAVFSIAVLGQGLYLSSTNLYDTMTGGTRRLLKEFSIFQIAGECMVFKNSRVNQTSRWNKQASANARHSNKKKKGKHCAAHPFTRGPRTHCGWDTPSYIPFLCIFPLQPRMTVESLMSDQSSWHPWSFTPIHSKLNYLPWHWGVQ